MITIRSNKLVFGGMRYFRRNAMNLSLGSFGEKRTAGLGASYLVEDGELDAEVVGRVKTRGPFHFNEVTNRTGSASLGLRGSLEGLGVSGSASLASEKLKSKELSILHISVDEDDLVDRINRNAEALSDLRHADRNARIVTEAWVVISARFDEAFQRSQSFNVTGARDELALELGGSFGKQRSTRLVLPESMTLAYMLRKIDWKKRRRQIDDLDLDQAGAG